MVLDKKELRRYMIKKRLNLDEKDYHQRSDLIINRLKNNEFFKKAKNIGIYFSYRHEVETISLIKEIISEKNIYAPKIHGRDMNFIKITNLSNLVKNQYGILEPIGNEIVNKKQLDLLIVPLVAYDKDYNRLGYGGGYYDRFLMDYQGQTIGLAFSFQKVQHLAIEDYDLPLDMIITDEK